MRYTIALQAGERACVVAEPGQIDFNGVKLLPHEAAILADALAECAENAEKQASLATYAAKYAAKSAAALQPIGG